jgi:hypothetical protein
MSFECDTGNGYKSSGRNDLIAEFNPEQSTACLGTKNNEVFQQDTADDAEEALQVYQGQARNGH